MKSRTFSQAVKLPVSAETAFAWHERPGALERLTPPWETIKVLHRTGGIDDGSRVELLTRIGPLSSKWVVEHRDCRAGRQFRDVALRGPFPHWDHLHLFKPLGNSQSQLEDRIEYTLPGEPFAGLFASSMVARRLERMFRYRHETTREDLAAWTRFGDPASMKICVTGSSGLVGSALIPLLTSGGHQVLRMVRKPQAAGPDEAVWDPAQATIDSDALKGIDAVVHLAGESIASGRWTAAKKKRIRASRVDSTRLLCETIARLHPPPRVLLSASAIGIYGQQGDRVLQETAAAGKGFLADVCRDWEAATEPALNAGIRVVKLRFGVILSPLGGLLARLLPPFRYGLGGQIGDGSGQQSWISIDDVIGAVHHALMTESLDGPLNLVAPNPVTNREFTSKLASVLRRPAMVKIPPWTLRTALGEMANELILASARVAPKRLLESGYAFRHATLDEALSHVLGRY